MDSSLINQAFKTARNENRPALLTYTVAGDNTKKKSIQILKSISKYADICELGFPHNTPIADGGQIQTSAYRAIKNGIKINDVFEIVNQFKKYKKNKPIILMGYYNKPDKTAEVMTEDGWFRTGDIGKFITGKNGSKFLKITDRKKELLKTSGGKYVAPAPIENKFKESFFVEQMMVVGEGKKFVSALIVPAFEALKEWAKDEGINIGSSNEEIIENDQVLKKFKEIVEEYNPEFSKIEQIKKFKLLANEWTDTSGELTPTMKIKRKVIRERHEKEINEIYGV